MELLTSPDFTEIQEQAGEMVLSQLMSGGPLRLVEALSRGYQIAAALQRIHASRSFCGTLHPSKIVLDPSRVTIVEDTADDNPTARAISPYTAPEQIDGKTGDGRSEERR